MKYERTAFDCLCAKTTYCPQKRGRGALVERLTASPVMHASRVRAPLILIGVFREISLFPPSHCD